MAKKSIPDTVIKWTHVSEGDPPNTEHIFAVHRGRIVDAYHWDGQWRDERDRKIKPTHWALWPTL